MALNATIDLNYTEEFRIACTINNLKFEEVLQIFINHASVYAFNGGDMGHICQLVSQVITNFKLKFKIDTVMSSNAAIAAISGSYMEMLANVNSDPELTLKMKADKSITIMENCSKDLLLRLNCPDKANLNGSHLLTMPFNFNLLCEMNGIDREQLLQYFIDHTSLAKDRALNLYESVDIKPCTTFVLQLLIFDENQKYKRLPQERIYVDYSLKLLDLDEELDEEADINYRIKRYRQFYSKWYNALRVQIN